jgi:cytochrome P450
MVPTPSLNPFSWYRKMQQESPVYYDPDFMLSWGSKGSWQVFRHADVKQVLGDYKTFSNDCFPNPDDNPISTNLANTDPPIHRNLRSIISKAFVPSVINDLGPWIRHISHEMLDPVLKSGEMDFVHDFAGPIPVRVITRLLGVPDHNYKQVHSWSKAITANPAEIEDFMAVFQRTQQEMVEFFLLLIEERVKNPQKDLISDLIAAEVDGKKLSKEDLVSFCMILLIAGNDTTTNLLGSTVLTLIEHPEIQEHLIQNPTDIPKVIQEVLRYRSPVQSLSRLVTCDVEIGGHKIKKGEYITVWLGSANHDSSVFPNPEKIDINRDNHAQISFGHGIHYCIGAPLAKLEATIALEVLFQKVEQIQLKPGATLEVHPSTLFYSLKNLPVTFKKR